MNNYDVIVYGPPGCGKTLHKEALAAAFGCKRILDESEDEARFKREVQEPRPRTLILTCNPHLRTPFAERHSFDEAMRMNNIKDVRN
ncbi:MAG: hypothetical protein CML29_17310 [Rhizobiales bacterium]|nr:hypothetical protein [Hyphomicrobiales bacterium]MBA68660.1 hypothetical protein [Hyphomicrobiales bacterium]|tara:strand:- start:591 stop:851 length:261 start_codon:yes stop_codon:yes gene_type:complete